MVIRAERFGNRSLGRLLADIPDVVVDRVRLQSAAGVLGGEGRDQRRIETTTEKDAERYVRNQTARDRPVEQFAALGN